MATYTVQTAVQTGVVPTQNAVAASDKFNNDGKTVLWVENGSGGELTVTLTTAATVGGVAIADPTVTIANGAKKVIGPFATSIYNDSNGQVTVAYSATTSVTAAVIRIP